MIIHFIKTNAMIFFNSDKEYREKSSSSCTPFYHFDLNGVGTEILLMRPGYTAKCYHGLPVDDGS